jgi:hypothetical protein
MVIERYDKSICYVTDGVYTIMALTGATEFSNGYNLHPFNTTATHFYTMEAKAYKYLNFIGEPEPSNSKNPHHFEPQYFFRNRIDEFINTRQKIDFTNLQDMIVVSKWSPCIINISCSGCYAPALRFIEYNRKSNVYPLNYLEMSCVLWRSEIK